MGGFAFFVLLFCNNSFDEGRSGRDKVGHAGAAEAFPLPCSFWGTLPSNQVPELDRKRLTGAGRQSVLDRACEGRAQTGTKRPPTTFAGQRASAGRRWLHNVRGGAESESQVSSAGARGMRSGLRLAAQPTRIRKGAGIALCPPGRLDKRPGHAMPSRGKRARLGITLPQPGGGCMHVCHPCQSVLCA